MPQSSLLTQFFSKLKTIILFVFVFSAVLGGAVYLNSIFKVESVEVVNNGSEVKIAGLIEYVGTNIIFLKTDEVSNKIKVKNPYLKKVEVEKIYPSTLNIKALFYIPEAQLNVGTGFFLLSEDGRILAKNKTEQPNITMINFYQKLNYYSYSSGDYITINDITESIYYIKLLENLGMKVDNLDIKDRDMLLCNIGDKIVIFTTSKSRDKQSYELTEIIKQFKITGTDYESIDLRFKKPIIKF